MMKRIGELNAENARFKAEVERLQSIHSIDSIGIEQLKAEVERLNSELHTCSCANAKMNMHMNENARLKAECQARQAENSVLAVECDSLKAEVERLTKVEGSSVPRRIDR